MSFKKPAAGGKSGYQSPARSGFGGFGGFSTTSSTLSYISEPPDLAAVSDANVVVSLKNLLKKDATTKAKGLEDLLVYIQEHPYDKDGGVEEPVLEAWVKLYGRTSIDNSRRVRELCHNVQLELMKSARKRMERRIPKVAGPWIAGTYDRDRVVSRAATDGLSSFLNSDDKVTQFWRRLQAQILDYALESVRETPDTLSDERSTNKEESEAKYYRVVGASLSLVLNLLQKVGIDQNQEQLEQYLGEETVWALAAAEDAHVRRMLYQLATTCLQQHDDLLTPHLPRLGKAIVSDALKIKQTGSALHYVQVLTTLSSKHPEVWGTKKHPFSRLQSFVQSGSQGSSHAFWQELRQLIAVLAPETISPDVAKGFLKALRTGISSREEPRANAPYAWACYFETFLLFLDKLTPEESRLDFIKDTFFPVTEQYMHPVAEKSSWTTAAPLSLLPKAWATLAAGKSDEKWKSASEAWRAMGVEFESRLNGSLPEVSKEFQSSQQSVAEEGDRWFALAGAIDAYITANYGQDADVMRMREPFAESSRSVLHEAVELLIRRNFKPFGAASVVESGLKHYPAVLPDDASFLLDKLYLSRDEGRLKALLSSSSAPYLLSSFNILGTMPKHSAQYEEIWHRMVFHLLMSQVEHAPARLSILLSTEKGKALAQDHEVLQDYLVYTSLDAARGTGATWELLNAALTQDALTDSSVKKLGEQIVRLVIQSTEPKAAALEGLEHILRHKPSVFSDASDLRLQLLTTLLALTEISDESVSARVTILRALLDKDAGRASSLVAVVQKNLDWKDGQKLLEVDTLVEQAKSLLDAKTVPAEQLLPNTDTWMDQLGTSLRYPAGDAPLTLTSSLGGAYYLCGVSDKPALASHSRDKYGRSIPARMALYTTKLLQSGLELSSLPQSLQTELLYLLCVVAELAEDELLTRVPDRTDVLNTRLWLHRDESLDAEVQDFISSTRRIVSDAVSSDDSVADGSKLLGGSPVGDLIAVLLEHAVGLSPGALYSAKALSNVLSLVSEAQGTLPNMDDMLARLNILKADSATFFRAVAFLTGLGPSLATSKAVKLFCNRMISDVAGAVPDEATLRRMVLLNACLAVYADGELPVESRRQIFAVRQITSWLDKLEALANPLGAEACKALNRLFPNIASVYGTYWEQAIAYCIVVWNGDYHKGHKVNSPSEPLLHASLKMYATLESLKGENDDLDDALAAHAEEKSAALLHLLASRGEKRGNDSDDIVDALLCRQVAKIPLAHIKDPSDLYGLVASESREIQTAAFGILSKVISAAQSQISVDVLLEKRDAKLPDELLSLLLDAPSHDTYADDELARFPNAVRSYLLSWRLVFDAFGPAASKVRADYAEQLKTSSSLPPLLDFIFDTLGHSAARALNLDRAGLTAEGHIRHYDIHTADGEPDERNMQWLLVHLFYLTLKYLPGPFKTWFLDCRSKQTKVAVEAWMTRYFSPIIVAENLDEVVEWAAQQEAEGAGEDEKELTVKVSRAAKEITAGYEVDEDQASIAIRIPAAYPLESVSVVGINRVAVSEKKWQNWLMITQGVITLGNGSIIDGLTTFKRNVVGALKGQTECAICYSIVSTDKKLPDKKCGTCRNAFHRTCLYKWFQTSHQNTCPLCRNPIDYLGAR